MTTDTLVHAESTVTHSPEETRAFGRDLAKRLVRGSVVLLSGDLGAGKTTLAQGVCHGLGVDAWACSPTFTLINEYKGHRSLYHVDLYRLNSPDEALALGLEDYFESEGITAVEWAERAGDLIPEDATHVYFDIMTNPNERLLRIEVRDASPD